MKWNCLLVKSARPQTYLLFELTMLVENESPRTRQDDSKSSSVTEMTCGFATLDLLGGNFLKTTTEMLYALPEFLTIYLYFCLLPFLFLPQLIFIGDRFWP